MKTSLPALPLSVAARQLLTVVAGVGSHSYRGSSVEEWSKLTCHQACYSYWELFFLIKFFLSCASLWFISRAVGKVDSDNFPDVLLDSEEEVFRGP